MDTGPGKQLDRSPRTVLLTAALTIALALHAGALQAARHHAACPPRGAHVQAADRQIAAYFLHGPDTMVVCDRASGFREQIGTPTTYAFPAPAIAVRGRLIAFGDTYQGLGDIVPSRLSPPNFDSEPGAPLIAGDSASAKLITLKLKTDGAFAWMTCHIHGPIRPYLVTGRHARCQHPGAGIYVYKHDARQDDGERTLLAHGNTIDPQSLRLHGSTVSWKQHGHTRTRTLH